MIELEPGSATERYSEDGYAIVEPLLTRLETVALLERLDDYTHGGRPADAIAVQTEPAVARGELHVAHPGDAIRKIEGLVRADPLFGELARHPVILAFVTHVLGPDVKVFRDAVMMKPPSVGSQKGWHQDSPYWPIEPMSLCSLWLPLNDATVLNGCMNALPGTHRAGPLPHVHVTDDFVIPDEALPVSVPVPLEMRAGSGLFFHSLLPHYTAPNRSDQWRRAVVISYMSARSRFTGEGVGPEYLSVAGLSYDGCVR